MARRVLLAGIFFSIFLYFLQSAYAEDFSIPHQFSSGDVLSASVLNEIFFTIQDSNQTVTEIDLLGEWSCDSAVQGNLSDESVVDGWEHINGLVWNLTDSTLVFEADETQNYSMISSSPNPFFLDAETATNSTYMIRAGLIYFHKLNNSSQVTSYVLKKVGETRFVMTPVTGSNLTATLICDKQNLPPPGPSELAASLSGNTVSLAWTDNSDDESSFSILRKDSLTGDYIEVGTISSDITIYTEAVSDGTYWYRVLALNANGNSIGSNVVKVSVE